MKARYRISALIALALGPAACGRGCTCFEGEKTYEKVKGKYEVSLVRKTRWVGGRIPGPVSNFYVHVATDPPIDEPIGDCTHADMAEDKEGKHVAFRCRDTHEREWTVLRLRGGDRRIRECHATVGTDDPPDWKKLESVRASTSRVLGCDSLDRAYAMEELAHAVLEDEGSSVASDYVNTLAAIGPAPFPDPWDHALRVVDEPTRKNALAKLCPALAERDAKTEPATYVRAARHCPLETSGALAMLRAMLARKAPGEDKTATAALVWSALLAAKASPKESGAVLCEAASAPPPIDWPKERESIMAALLGQTKTKCAAAVNTWLEHPPCNFLIDCDAGLCTESELAADLEGWDTGLDAGVRGDPAVPDRDRAILRAAYAAGPLPKELVVRNQRRRYDRPDASMLLDCNDDRLEAGAACQCGIQTLTVCEIGSDERIIEQRECTMRIDDAHKRLEVGHRTCEALGASCRDHPCCGDALCQREVCVRRSVPDAGGD